MTNHQPTIEEPKITPAMITAAIVDALKRLRAQIAAGEKDAA